MKLLIGFATDVYNDDRMLTLSPKSQASKSLANICTNNQIVSFKDGGLPIEFSEFDPSAAVLQYNIPVLYRSMLNIVGRSDMQL